MLCHATRSESCLCVPTEPVVVSWFLHRTRTHEKCSALVHRCTLSSFQYQTKCLFLVHLKIYFFGSRKLNLKSIVDTGRYQREHAPTGPVKQDQKWPSFAALQIIFPWLWTPHLIFRSAKENIPDKEKSIWIELDVEHCLWPRTFGSWNNVKIPMPALLTYKSLLCRC